MGSDARRATTPRLSQRHIEALTEDDSPRVENPDILAADAVMLAGSLGYSPARASSMDDRP